MPKAATGICNAGTVAAPVKLQGWPELSVRNILHGVLDLDLVLSLIVNG